MIKSQLLYRLSYGLKSHICQGIWRGLKAPDSGRNGNGTYIYGTQRVTSIVATPNLVPSERDPIGQGDYFDESGWRHHLDSGDLAMMAPDSDRALYILLAIMLVGLTALFGASAYMLLG